MPSPTSRLSLWSGCCLIGVLATVLTVSAAEPQPELQPTALTSKSLPLADVATKEMEPLDLVTLAREDALRDAQGLPWRFAVAHPVAITPFDDGTWEQIDPKRQMWRLRITSPDATTINLGFTRYEMPPGAMLYIYAVDLTDSIRPFTDSDNSSSGQLWTPVVRSSDIIVELTIPVEQMHKLVLELGSINIGYRGFGLANAGVPEPRSGACNIDVACPVADPWRLQIPGVGAITLNGSNTCTGFMVNNTAQDLTPYFMTAAHCGVSSGNAATLVSYWNYENSTCRPPGSPASGGPGDGLRNQFSSGATWLAGYSPSDVTLVRFNTAPNPAWNLSWLGWDRQGLNPPSGACIHHPRVEEKRITFYDVADRPDRPSHGSSWPCSTFPGPGDNSHIRVYWKLEGAVTEPGSSGSPLFDNNKRVIGQLHGGPSACGATGDNLSDCYGRFSLSWTGGGTNSTRLSNWLDPLNTGVQWLDTISGGGLTVTPAANVEHIGPVGGPFTNDTVVYTLTNPTPNPLDYEISLAIDFGIEINGGSGPISGTLPPTGGSTNITVTLGAPIAALPAGIYVESINFEDVTNSRTQTRQHTVEIGQANFTVTPAGGLTAGGPEGGPFLATQVYTLTSTRPTPCQVEISANQPWISIDGGTSPVTVNLPTQGSTANVTIGYSAAANSLAAGLYSGTVAFTNLTTPPLGNATRPVNLEVGRYSYTSADTPIPMPDLSTVVSTINIADVYCIGDVDVPVNISHTYIGDLTVELTSPQGTTVRLHNRTGGSADDIVRTYDQGVTNPDGPGSLNDFNGQFVTGTWTLRIVDNAAIDSGTLNSWSLKILPLPACAPQARNISANVPDSVSTNLMLDVLSINPPALQAVIMSLPANGTLHDPNAGLITTVPYTLAANGKIARYQPNAYYIGPDSFTYKAFDGLDSPTATCSISVGLVSVIYNFPLDTDPGWTADPDWGFGVNTNATTCGSGRLDPTTGFTGTNVYGYNLNGCYPNSLTPTRWLTTTTLDLRNVINVSLEFRRWLGIESATFDKAYIDISNTNGSSWTNVWTHTGATLNEQSWSLQTYDISAAASNQQFVKIRWGLGPTDSSVTYQGWNLDDIQIRGIRPPLLGDLDNDGDRDGNDLFDFLNVLLGIETDELKVSRADVNIDGKADGRDIQTWVALP